MIIGTCSENAPIGRTFFNKRGRPVSVETSDSTYEWNTTTFSYTGFSTTVTDPDGCQKTEKKDAIGRLVQVIEYNSGAQYNTYYTYNAAGDLLQVRNHNNTFTTMTYDTLGRKATMSDPDMGNWAYSYDLNGNLVSQADGLTPPQTISFTYDDLNRVKTKTYSTGDPATTYTYDNLAAGKNGRGRLWQVSNSNAATIYNEYDVMGRVKLVTRTITGDSARATQYDYDLSGKLTHIGYPGTTGLPNGFQLYYTYYPGTGLLQTVTGSDLVEYADFSDYEPTGKIGAMDFGNGTSTSYFYDPKSTRLLGITTHDPSGQPTNDIQRRTYTYSQAGDITGIHNQIGNLVYTYGYDPLHRLIWEKTNGVTSATYAYNAIGNITSKTMGSDNYVYAYHATKIHAVSQVTKNGTAKSFTYDNNGNLTSGWDMAGTPVARTIAYNADNMPLSVTRSGVTTTFAYDGNGSRVKKTASGTTTYYIGEHFEKIGTNETIYVFAGDIRIARKQSSTTHYYHKDHLGSSTVMTTAAGTIAESTVYWPYGYTKSQSGSSVTGYKFTDQELDATTGLYDYGARLYDPVIGRFVTADTIVQNFSDPQTLNRYSYCRNNPLIYIDPSGHSWLSDFFKGYGGSIIGVAFTLAGMPYVGAFTGSAFSTAVNGGDIGDFALGLGVGMVSGFAGGCVSGSIAQATGMNLAGIETALLRGGLSGAIAGAGTAAIYGGNIWSGALGGAIGGMSTASMVWGYRAYKTECFIKNNVKFTSQSGQDDFIQALKEAGQSPLGQKTFSAYIDSGKILTINSWSIANARGSIGGSDIWLNPDDTQYNDSNSNYAWARTFDQATVMLHEMGHNLGYSDYPQSLNVAYNENPYRAWIGAPNRSEYSPGVSVPSRGWTGIVSPWR